MEWEAMTDVARKKRTSVLQQYRLFKEIFTKDLEWEKVGWKPVPRLEGKGLSSWDMVENAHFGGQRIFKCVNDCPYAIVKQELITRHDVVRKLPCKSVGTLKSWVEKQQKSIASRVLACCDNTFKTSKGWSTEMSRLIDMKVPTYLEVQEQNAIITWGGWFTEGHIEIAGDESVAHVPVGKKLFLIAKRGAASKFLAKQTRCAKEFMNLVTGGPPEKYREKIFYYISDPESLLVQPALCAHSVLTLSRGTAIVTGWEAANAKDENRFREVTSYYGLGVGTGKLKKLKALPKEERDKGIQTLNEAGSSDMGDLFNRLHLKGAWVEPCERSKRGRPAGLSKKKRKMLNVRGMREEKLLVFLSAAVCNCFLFRRNKNKNK